MQGWAQRSAHLLGHIAARGGLPLLACGVRSVQSNAGWRWPGRTFSRRQTPCPVAQVLGLYEQKDLACGVGDQYIGQLSAQAFMAQIGVGVERDIGVLNAKVFAARDFLDAAVEIDDVLGIAGREFVAK